MKKCPTCGKTFEDSMRFCQVDGTPLLDELPEAPFDPYATIVSSPKPQMPVAEPEPKPPAPEPAAEAMPVPDAIATPIAEPAPAPIAEPHEVLDLPANDPLKTVFVSDAEMRDALGAESSSAAEPVIDLPPVEEPPVAESYAAPEPPSFNVPDVPAPSFGDAAPPPSPFAPVNEPAAPVETSAPEPPSYDTPLPPPPVFDEPEPSTFDEAATMIQPAPAFEPPPAPAFEPPPAPAFEPTPVASFEPPPPAPVAEWTPPPAPDASWQNQEIGSNTPFQPPPAGTGAGDNKTLAIVSLVLGIISLCCYVSPVTGLAALITGFMAMKKANNDPANYGGKGLAIAGMITGGIFFLVGIAYWIYLIVVIGFVGLSSFSR